MMELRIVIATLVRRFDFTLEPNLWNPEQWERDARDEFILKKGSLPVIVRSRA
jgi:cytochrome P450